MEIREKLVTLRECFFNDSSFLEENINFFKWALRRYIQIAQNLIENHDNLTGKELFEELKDIYDIRLDKDDYLFMLSKYNKKRYTYITKIPTKMFFLDREIEGYGKGFDWWMQPYQVYYNVAVSDEFKVDYNKTYSKDEIKKMIANKDVVVIDMETSPIKSSGDKEEYENLPMLGIDFNDCYGDCTCKFTRENDDLFKELLMKTFPRKRILAGVRDLICEINYKLDIIFSYIDPTKSSFLSDMAIICKEWFDSSEEKKDYVNLIKTLKLENRINEERNFLKSFK